MARPKNLWKKGRIRRRWRLVERVQTAGSVEEWRSRHVKTGDLRRVWIGVGPDARRELEERVAALAARQRSPAPGPRLPRLLDWSLTEEPFVVELENSGAVTLEGWARDGGLVALPASGRIELARRIAALVAAVHESGVRLGGELEPRHVRLSEPVEASVPEPLLTGLSAFCRHADGEAGEAAAARDVRALGVLAYQLLCADLERKPGAFWERDLADEILREDVAAALEPEAERRISARELETRLAGHGPRQEERERQRSRRLEASGRTRSRIRAGVLLGVLLLVLAAGWALHAELRRRDLEQELRRLRQELPLSPSPPARTPAPRG